MTSRFRPPWYLRFWLIMCPRARLHVSSSQLTTFLTLLLFFVAFFVFTVLLQLFAESDPPDRPKYIPMIQFNRGDVNKDLVLENARRALQKVAEYKMNSGEEIKDPKSTFGSLLQMMDKKEKRQFLALEAFNIYDIDDFETLMEMGYEMNKKTNLTLPTMDYKNSHKNIEHVSPDYDKLCYKTSFTLSNSKRPMDESFCDRLKFLENEIKEGRELPLLTIYTWWPDPITDQEVLSKRAVLANWNLFRPFIIPVVFTNYRMNMAVANAHGWPCLPVEYENEANLPIFKHTAVTMEQTFKSTFYGYAMANSMFDSSLLLTLLNIKDRFVLQPLPPKEKTDSISDTPLIVYGKPINTPAVGLETFEKMEYFHRHVENAVRRNESLAMSLTNAYVIYRGIDFSNDSPVIIDDDYLIPYLVTRRMRYRTILIDSSETILSAKTHRHLNVNEWGRNYIQPKPRDKLYNKRYLDDLKSEGKETHESTKARGFMSEYDDRNRIRMMLKKYPIN